MPMNAQILWFWTMVTTLVTYVVVSLISGAGKPAFNMDQLLHRGRYAIDTDTDVGTDAPEQPAPRQGLAIFGMGKEFSLGDRMLFIFSYVYVFGIFGVFIFGSFYMLSTDVATRRGRRSGGDTPWSCWC
jgi:hypothetical protein